MNAELDHIFAALADPTRRDLVARLAASDATVGELAEPYAMSVQAVSKHLTVLERAGLVTKSRDGQRRHCRISVAPLQDATSWLELYRRHWEEQLDNLGGYLASLSEPSHEGPDPIQETS